MAVPSTIVKEVIAASFEENFHAEQVWLPYVKDESSEIAVQGKLITVAKVDESGFGLNPSEAAAANAREPRTLANYSEDSTAAQLQRGVPRIFGVDSVNLLVDKVYDIDFLVSQISERRTRPSLIEAFTRHTARRVREQMNLDIRSEYDNAANEVSTAATITTTAANWGNPAHLDKIQEMLEAATIKADGMPHFFPQMGRTVITGPANYALIRKYLIKEKLFLTTGITDRAASGAEVIEWEGWRIIKDNSIPTARTNADDANHNWYFMVQGYPAVAAAYELDIERVFESEDYRGTRAVGTFTWGHKVINDNKLLIQKQEIT